LRPKVDVWRVLLWGAEAARIGGACLAVAVVVFAPAAEIVLALLGVVLLVVGGTAWSWARPVALRLTGPLLAVVLARVLGGPAAALLAALLVVVGAWLRVRVPEATAGLAVFGVAVTILGGASARVVGAFWLLGVGVLLARFIAAGAGRRLRAGSSLTAERPSTTPLRPEN
jgi:hypothetical protein